MHSNHVQRTNYQTNRCFTFPGKPQHRNTGIDQINECATDCKDQYHKKKKVMVKEAINTISQIGLYCYSILCMVMWCNSNSLYVWETEDPETMFSVKVISAISDYQIQELHTISSVQCMRCNWSHCQCH